MDGLEEDDYVEGWEFAGRVDLRDSFRKVLFGFFIFEGSGWMVNDPERHFLSISRRVNEPGRSNELVYEFWVEKGEILCS